MGELSANRQALIIPARGHVDIRYYADFAEIPARSELVRMAAEGESYAQKRMRELADNLTLTADGRPLALTLESAQAVKIPGQGGLETVTVIGHLRARWSSRWSEARVLRFSDRNFGGLAGWHEIRVQVGLEHVRGVAPSETLLSPTQDFHPLSYSGTPRADDEIVVSLDFRSAPGAAKDAGAGLGVPSAPARARNPLVDLIGSEVLTPKLLLFALAVSAALGASHALSPGHGKTIVAAYLVGSRGTVSHAVLLGLVVTVTHVSSVILLGVVTLYLSEFILPERLYPWLGVISGAAVAAIGTSLLIGRVRAAWRGDGREHDHHSHHGEAHRHAGFPEPAAGAVEAQAASLWRLLLLGVTGGIVPCPSALVVLLAAIALHRIALGLALILAFSVGLAAVLIAAGVLAVKAYGLVSRMERFGAVTRALGVASAAAVTILGILIVIKTGSALI